MMAERREILHLWHGIAWGDCFWEKARGEREREREAIVASSEEFLFQEKKSRL